MICLKIEIGKYHCWKKINFNYILKLIIIRIIKLKLQRISSLPQDCNTISTNSKAKLMIITAKIGKFKINVANSKIISLKAHKKNKNWVICSKAKIHNMMNSEISTPDFRWKLGRKTSLSLMFTK